MRVVTPGQFEPVPPVYWSLWSQSQADPKLYQFLLQTLRPDYDHATMNADVIFSNGGFMKFITLSLLAFLALSSCADKRDENSRPVGSGHRRVLEPGQRN
jgi:hypothetical protein